MPNAIVNGISIDYSVTGDGSPVLLICGTGQPADLWFAQVADLAAAGHSATGVAVLPGMADLDRQHRPNRRRTPGSTLTRASAPKENAMDSHATFLNCTAYMDKDGATRCGLPAEVEYRYTMNSTDGPLESAKISCPRRHHFNAPIEYLTLPEQPTATAAPASPAAAPTVQSAPPHARGVGERS